MRPRLRQIMDKHRSYLGLIRTAVSAMLRLPSVSRAGPDHAVADER